MIIGGRSWQQNFLGETGHIKSCSNNLIVWTGAGDWPDQSWPELLNAKFPGCFKVTKDINVWNAAKQNWINCHPMVAHLPGDPAAHPEQCDPSAYGGGGTALPITSSCTLINPSTTLPAGWGAPWDVFSSSHETLIGGDCTGSTASVNVGTGSLAEYIYKLGYTYNGSAWKPVTLTGTNLVANSWYSGSAKTSIPLLAGQPTFFVGYVCQWTGSDWKCGCADSTCSQSLWQLQAFKP